MKTCGLTHPGWVRINNEDRFLIKKLSDTSCILAVADGMGGQAGGEIAAQTVIDTVGHFAPGNQKPSEALLRQLTMAANNAIQEEASRNPYHSGMGTTATLAWIDVSTVFWCHVGDSRLYHYHDTELQQITFDHNLAGTLVRAGELTPEEARVSPMRNILHQCVGCSTCNPDTGHFEVREGDLLLLCTDGLCGSISDKKIASLLAEPASLQDKAESLINKALSSGGADNVTVIVAEI